MTRAAERAGRDAAARGTGTPGGRLPESEVALLWRRLKVHGDRKAWERLVLHYAPLVKYVAGRMCSKLPAHVDGGDLISCGLMGLMNAIDRFDPARRVRFETYATTRIKGAIIDELRARDWVPRSLRMRARRIERALADLEVQLQRPPTDVELADALGISVVELHDDMLQLASSSFLALDETWILSRSGEATRLLDSLPAAGADAPEEALAAADLRDALADGIASLPERERTIVALYHYDGLSMSEIAEAMGISEGRVSQLHTRAILTLRGRLGRTSSQPARRARPVATDG